MKIKFLKLIVESLINKSSITIIDLLVGKKDVNEFLIAKKLGLTINQTRNILYRLSDYRLVSFIRKKDKRKGWYIYFWTLDVHQSLSLLESKLKVELEQLKNQLKNKKEKRYYFCNSCSIEVTEETALLNNFTCPECEGVYDLLNNKKDVISLEKRIIKVKKEIELVTFEKNKESNRLINKKNKRIKKEQIEKIKDKKSKKIAKRRAIEKTSFKKKEPKISKVRKSKKFEKPKKPKKSQKPKKTQKIPKKSNFKSIKKPNFKSIKKPKQNLKQNLKKNLKKKLISKNKKKKSKILKRSLKK